MIILYRVLTLDLFNYVDIMKKDCYKRIDSLRRINDEDFECHPNFENVDVEDASKAKDSLLSIVYALDERMQVPSGDLHYLVSDKANPQVKQFILDNLMMDVSSAKNISAPADLDDSVVLELSRRDGESIEEYASRLNTSIDRDKWLMSEYKKNVQSRSEQSPVSSE